jgi:hypothetical protein
MGMKALGARTTLARNYTSRARSFRAQISPDEASVTAREYLMAASMPRLHMHQESSLRAPCPGQARMDNAMGAR